jgi:hypothetical protein
LVHSIYKKKTKEETRHHAIFKRQISGNCVIQCCLHITIHILHGRPTRHDYETLKKEVANLASKVDNFTFVWSHDPATGEEFGLLAKIIGNVEYTHLTNLMWN